MFWRTKARRNCIAAIPHSNTCELLSDTLWPTGEYRAFWKMPNGSVLECECHNIFSTGGIVDTYSFVCESEKDENKPPCQKITKKINFI